MTSDKYPGIAKAALAIALDNGGINRMRSQDDMRRELSEWLDARIKRVGPHEIGMIDLWLSLQTDEQLHVICCGEHTEMLAATLIAPNGTEALLTDYFEEVC